MGHSRNPSAASCISFASFISEPISELNEGNEHFDALCDERRFLSNTNACAHVWGRNVFLYIISFDRHTYILFFVKLSFGLFR